MLVRANLRGHDSHGVIRVPQYVAALQARDAQSQAPDEDWSSTHRPWPSSTATAASARSSPGAAMGLAIERARAHGLAAVALRGANHVGRLADYAEMAAAQGLIGLLWANARGGPQRGAVGRRGPAARDQSARRRGAGARTARWPCRTTSPRSVWAEGKLRVKFNRGEKVAARHHAQRTRRAVDRSARVLHRPARLAAHRRRPTRATACRSPSRSWAASCRARARPAASPRSSATAP